MSNWCLPRTNTQKMNVFELRDRLTGDYSDFVRSFIHIRDDRIREAVQADLEGGLLWPDPLIQLNPSFEPGDWVDELVAQGVLHEECKRIFRIKPEQGNLGQPLRLHRHQSEAVRTARAGNNYATCRHACVQSSQGAECTFGVLRGRGVRRLAVGAPCRRA